MMHHFDVQIKDGTYIYFRNYFGKFKIDALKMWDGINLVPEQTRKKKTLPNSVTNTDRSTVT
jgi:hypothetical protein